MTRDPRLTRELLLKLEQHLQNDAIFTAEECELIRKMVKAWRGILAFGAFSRWVIGALGLIAAGVLSWEQLLASIRHWWSS